MFREKIRKARLYAGIKQQDMAKMAGMCNSSYNRIENGYLKIDKSDINKIAKILEINENELITYWIADNIYSFVKNDKQHALDAIDIVLSHVDDYETLVKTPEKSRREYPYPNKRK